MAKDEVISGAHYSFLNIFFIRTVFVLHQHIDTDISDLMRQIHVRTSLLKCKLLFTYSSQMNNGMGMHTGSRISSKQPYAIW